MGRSPMSTSAAELTAEPLVQYWHEPQPPREISELLDSCAGHNPAMQHLVFDRARAAAFIEEHFSAREVAAFRACAVPAMQADYFRYCAVLALGGAYVDADLRCVAPLLPLLPRPEGVRLFGRVKIPPGWPVDLFGTRPSPGRFRLLANSVFFVGAPHHPLLELVKDVATANVESRLSEDIVLTTGPGILTSLYLVERLGSFEAFREHVADGILATSAELLCEVAGSPRRVAAAFAGVEISPFPECRASLTEVASSLPYKQTDAHWVNHRGTIFST